MISVIKNKKTQESFSDVENEDVDRAIALSLSEEEQKKADVAGE